MAKKARKKTFIDQGVQTTTSSFDEVYPAVARWISHEGGWVELGADHHSHSLARALYGGGMAWEGTDDYKSLGEALKAMDGGISAWLEEHRPARVCGGSMEKKRPAGSAEIPKARKRSPPKATGPNGDDWVKADAAPPVPRAIVQKVRKFADMAEALRRGERFEITRLTSLKALCKEPRAAWRFALFLAEHAGGKVAQGQCPERDKALAAQAVSAMKAYMDEPSPERGSRLRSLLREVEAEQDETRRVGWNRVRMIRNRDLLVVENALRSVAFIVEAPAWLYQAARDYAERYDPRHGTGLIPSSAPMMREIADFWRGCFGIER